MTLKKTTLYKYFYASVILGVAVSYSHFYLFHLLFFLVMLVLTTSTVYKPPTNLHYIFYFMFAWYFISILWSINIFYSLTYLYYILIGSGIVYISIHTMNTITKQNEMFRIISTFYAFNIIFSILESFTSFRLPISPLSEYVNYFGRNARFDHGLGENILLAIKSSPTGFNWNPNNLAVVMTIAIPFVIFSTNKWKKLWLILILIVIFMSGSKGSIIALLFSALIYVLISFSLKKILLTSSLLFILITFFFNSGVFKLSENSKVSEIANTTVTLNKFLFDTDINSDSSIGARQQLIANGISALIDSYGIGVGGGGSIMVQEIKGGVGSHQYLSMHNFWIEILVDAGVFFTLIFLYWYFNITYLLWKIGKKSKNNTIKYYAESLTFSYILFFISSISASTAIFILPMWLMFGFSIATINNEKRLFKK